MNKFKNGERVIVKATGICAIIIAYHNLLGNGNDLVKCFWPDGRKTITEYFHEDQLRKLSVNNG